MTPSPGNKTARLTRCALFTAIALAIFLVEAQIPVPVAIPGVKPGLANIVTVCAVYLLGPADALLILLGRVILGAVGTGRMMTLFYSLGGGLAALMVLVLLRRVTTRRQLWLISPLAAAAHNLGQLLVAAGLMKSWTVLAYLPYLLLAGVCAGLFTGLCAQFLLARLPETLLRPKQTGRRSSAAPKKS